MAAMIVAVVASLFGCAGHEDTFYRNTAAIRSLNGSRPLSGAGTFRGVWIDFDAIGDWSPLREASPEVFAAYQNTGVPLYTRTLVVMQLHPPKTDFADDQGFIEAARRSIAADRTREKRRIELDMATGTGEWKSCVRFYKKFTTEDSRSAPGQLFTEEVVGYVCRHPKQPSEVLGIYYSERYPVSTDVGGFIERASDVLSGIGFTSH
ncbi:MAG: hypothetical protein P8173_16310 [Gammaproteobacteria bacterium]